MAAFFFTNEAHQLLNSVCLNGVFSLKTGCNEKLKKYRYGALANVVDADRHITAMWQVNETFGESLELFLFF